MGYNSYATLFYGVIYTRSEIASTQIDCDLAPCALNNRNPDYIYCPRCGRKSEDVRGYASIIPEDVIENSGGSFNLHGTTVYVYHMYDDTSGGQSIGIGKTVRECSPGDVKRVPFTVIDSDANITIQDIADALSEAGLVNELHPLGYYLYLRETF